MSNKPTNDEPIAAPSIDGDIDGCGVDGNGSLTDASEPITQQQASRDEVFAELRNSFKGGVMVRFDPDEAAEILARLRARAEASASAKSGEQKIDGQ